MRLQKRKEAGNGKGGIPIEKKEGSTYGGILQRVGWVKGKKQRNPYKEKEKDPVLKRTGLKLKSVKPPGRGSAAATKPDKRKKFESARKAEIGKKKENGVGTVRGGERTRGGREKTFFQGEGEREAPVKASRSNEYY